ncbi:uncharacterized protein LOC111311621 isoform X2 [Durio zibethinus]|uniref:Uncharacterized protein LOC111311621 isoform X2 n=1 Tax=Durio zibethinus TaxID=66656 RepID=A0A6P6APR7_DURZI|nr:uncharacterized protein LOC111311621 isoform X2 [Durio zibethinus]
MEDLIANLSKSLGSFCNHLQSSCDALKQSIDRRPIPLDSASSTFVQCLNRRVSTATSDLNLLDSMSFGTVSFEELLGHCYQIFNKNQTDLLDLEDRLKPLGYFPPDHKTDDSDLSFGENMKYNGHKPIKIEGTYERATDTFELTKGEMEIDLNPIEVLRPVIQVSKDAYDSLPSYMTSLASWEDLLAAVEKINSSLSKKEKTKGYNYFHQDEIESLDLGPKGRAYLLLLVRMNHLVVETINGLISYRVL